MLFWGITGAVASPFMGNRIDRLGARTVMIAGTLLQCLATVLLARADALWQLYAALMLLSIANVCNTYIPVAAVIARWFVKFRGTATGVAMLGLGIGMGVMAQVASALLQRYDWRDAYAILGFAALAALIPIVTLIRNPKDADIDPNAAEAGPVDGAVPDPAHDLTLGEAFNTRSFWGISLGDALTGMVFAMFNFSLILFLTEDLGNAQHATNVFTTLQICLALGTAIFGLVADRLPLRFVMILCYALPVVATAFLMPAAGLALAFIFAIVGGLAGGGRQAIFPMALVHSFGHTHVGAIYGLSNSFFLIGNAVGPIVGSAVYELAGTTRAVYSLSIAIFAASAILIALMRRESKPNAAS